MNTDQTSNAAATARQRRVYYISGFDPRGARFYHQLYKTEAAQQEAINGCRYEVGKRQKTGEHSSSWQIKTTPAAPDTKQPETQTRYTFLGWDDLIRENWISNRAKVLAKMLVYYAHYLGNGGMRKTLASTPRGFASMVTPIFYTLVTLLLAALAGSMVTWLAGLLLQNQWLTSLMGLVSAAVVISGAVMLAEKYRLFWMMRIMLFVLHWARHNPPELEQRWHHFAERIHADNINNPDDEVLIVGHSVGALAAIAVAARYLELEPAPQPKPGAVKLLLLGSLTPLMGLVPQAGWFRDKLQRLGQSDLPWFDYTAPADPLCYRLVDPFAVCGLPAPAKTYKIRSARFDKMFSPAEFKRLSRDGFRIHFQYLMATQLPVDNDFFSLTTRPDALSGKV